MSDASPGFRQFREWVLQKAEDTEFDVETEDFGNLVIQEADGFYYFYDEAQRRLIKNFVLRVGPRVDTMCSVVLVPKEGGLTPRLRMWKKDKSQAGKAGAIAYEAIQANEESVLAKSSVDLDDAHENLWKLINFLESVQEIELPAHQFRVTPAANMELVRAFEGQDKGTVLAAVKAYLGNDLTEADVQMLVGRRRALERFEKMLEQPGFFAAEMHRRGKTRVEAVWQEFFEENQWIFGYGLNLVACEAYSDKGLELITTGANVFTGGGKRIDAVMRTRGFIQSLVFTEIKKQTHDYCAMSSTALRMCTSRTGSCPVPCLRCRRRHTRRSASSRTCIGNTTPRAASSLRFQRSSPDKSSSQVICLSSPTEIARTSRN